MGNNKSKGTRLNWPFLGEEKNSVAILGNELLKGKKLTESDLKERAQVGSSHSTFLVP